MDAEKTDRPSTRSEVRLVRHSRYVPGGCVRQSRLYLTCLPHPRQADTRMELALEPL
jgi:hypothetical protein